MTVDEIEAKFNEYQQETEVFAAKLEADDPHLEFIESLKRFVNR